MQSQQVLRSVAGNAIWLTQFKILNLDHLEVIELLLPTLCTLGMCCAISGTYAAYIAGTFNSYLAVTLCILKTTSSTILDPLFKRRSVQNLDVGPFTFKINGKEQTVNDDFSSGCEIKYEDVSIPFQIILIDAAEECSPKCNLNLVGFIWKYLVTVKFKMYAIVALPFDTPEEEILYLKHYRANSEGWVVRFVM